MRRISYIFKGRPEETSYEMLLYLVKRKVEERFLFVSIFHKTASTMNLTRYSILNLINAVLHNILWSYNALKTCYYRNQLLKENPRAYFFSSNLWKTLSYQILLQSAIRDEPDTVWLLPVKVFNNMNACLVVDEHF